VVELHEAEVYGEEPLLIGRTRVREGVLRASEIRGTSIVSHGVRHCLSRSGKWITVLQLSLGAHKWSIYDVKYA